MELCPFYSLIQIYFRESHYIFLHTKTTIMTLIWPLNHCGHFLLIESLKSNYVMESLISSYFEILGLISLSCDNKTISPLCRKTNISFLCPFFCKNIHSMLSVFFLIVFLQIQIISLHV